jgi:hypothetical protein
VTSSRLWTPHGQWNPLDSSASLSPTLQASIVHNVFPSQHHTRSRYRGYVDFSRLHTLHRAGSFFVTRAKSNLDAHRVYSRPVDRSTGLICDQSIALDGYNTSKDYPGHLRRIRYRDPETPIGIELAKRRTDGYGIEQGGEVFCLGGCNGRGSVRHTFRPSHGNTWFSSRSMSRLESASAQVGVFFANHSRDTATNESAGSRLTAFLWSLGSILWESNRFTSSRGV